MARDRKWRPSPGGSGWLEKAEAAVREIRGEMLQAALDEESRELAERVGGQLGPPESSVLPYAGDQYRVRVRPVQMPGGPSLMPPMLESLRRDPHGLLSLSRAGVSYRDVAPVWEAVSGRRAPRGASSSNVSRLKIAADEKVLEALRTRKLGPESIVAVYLDGTAIGRRGKKRTVMIAIGVTAEGRKLALDAWIAQDEKPDDLYPHLKKLVERGMDPRVLWISDGGAGIRTAIERVAGPSANHQLCRVHMARNVVKNRNALNKKDEKLPPAEEKWVRRRLKDAREADSERVALEELKALADELEEKGYKGAAGSLRFAMEGSVTVKQFNLPKELEKQLDTTNQAESANDSVKAALRQPKRWKDDHQRVLWIAGELLELEPESWYRLSSPRALVALGEALMPERYDAPTLLARLPPDLKTARVRVPLDDLTVSRDLAASSVDASPAATWAGTPEVLAFLGTQEGKQVLVPELDRALRGQHVTSEKRVRETAQISVVSRADDGSQLKRSVPGLVHLRWELSASPPLLEAWNRAAPQRRDELERSFASAARAAVETVTSTTNDRYGFATTMALVLPESGRAADPWDLRMRGIVVAIARGRERVKLASPGVGRTLRPEAAREAEDRAKEILDPVVGKSAALPGPGGQAQLSSARAGELRNGAREWALEETASVLDMKREDLEAAAGRLPAALQDLDSVEPAVSTWFETGGESAAGGVMAMREHLTKQERIEDPWFPLGRAERLALGQKRARTLLGLAAELRGKLDAGSDAKFLDQKAREVLESATDSRHKGGGDPGRRALLARCKSELFSGLKRPISIVEDAAKAEAARREVGRRNLFEAVVGRPDAASDLATATVAPTHQPGRPPKRPTERYSYPLGETGERLKSSADALLPGLKPTAVRPISDAALQRLAAAVDDPWAKLADPSSGVTPGSLLACGRAEMERDAGLGEWLQAKREEGLRAELATRAGDAREGTRTVETVDRWQKSRQDEQARLEKLEELEGKLAKLERTGPARFARDHPDAALADAIRHESLERGRARVKEAPQIDAPGIATPDAAGIELAG